MNIPGDFVEIGVANGSTFHRLVPLASGHGKIAHAIDSFQGMAAPGVNDRKEGEPGAHTQGQFACGGLEGFRQIMNQHGLKSDHSCLWEGFIPSAFQQVPQDLIFSFAIIDVDHYQPTRDSLEWLWPRLNSGGILCWDDCALSWDRESSLAIKEWLSLSVGITILDYYNNQLFLTKA
jgi:O-methyltransferase